MIVLPAQAPSKSLMLAPAPTPLTTAEDFGVVAGAFDGVLGAATDGGTLTVDGAFGRLIDGADGIAVDGLATEGAEIEGFEMVEIFGNIGIAL